MPTSVSVSTGLSENKSISIPASCNILRMKNGIPSQKNQYIVVASLFTCVMRLPVWREVKKLRESRPKFEKMVFFRSYVTLADTLPLIMPLTIEATSESSFEPTITARARPILPYIEPLWARTSS